MGRKKTMKKGRKLIATFMALTFMASTLTACGSAPDGSEGGSVSKQEEKRDTVELTFSYYGGNDELEAYDRMIKKFETENPHYKINPVFTDGGSYPTKLQAFFTSNTAPDVMLVANDVIYDFVQQDQFLDLTTFMEKDNLLDGTWAQNTVDAFKYGDKMVAAPLLAKPFAIVYNKDIFDKAGMPYPEKGWTEENFAETAINLTSGEGAEKIYGMHFGWMTNEFLRGLYTGHKYYDVAQKKLCFENDEAFKHSVELFSELIGRYGVSPNSTEAQGIGGGFETGRFAMSFINLWDMPGYNDVIGDSFKWDVVTLPASEEYGQWNTPLRIDGVAISASTEKQDAAWEFVKYLAVNMDTAREYDTFAVPALNAYTNTEEYKTTYPIDMANKYNREVFTEVIDYGINLQTAGVWGELNTVFAEEFDRILLEGITVDQALENMANRTKNKLN